MHMFLACVAAGFGEFVFFVSCDNYCRLFIEKKIAVRCVSDGLGFRVGVRDEI